MALADEPAGAVVLKSNASIRRIFVFLAAAGLVVFAAVAIGMLILFGPLLVNSAPASLVFLVGVASAPFALFSWVAYRRRDAVVDIEIAPGLLRLPFRKAPERRGWRSVAEVHLLAQHATLEAKQAAEAIVVRLQVPRRELLWNKQALNFWPQGRSLLAITDDEVLILRGETAVFDKLIAHWDIEKRRLVPGAGAPPPQIVP